MSKYTIDVFSNQYPPKPRRIISNQERVLQDVAYDLVALCENKNAAYGRNLQRHGLRGVTIRMSDKMQRLENLVLGSAEDKVNESTVDTLTDLAGYAMMALALLRLNNLSLNGEWEAQCQKTTGDPKSPPAPTIGNVRVNSYLPSDTEWSAKTG